MKIYSIVLSLSLLVCSDALLPLTDAEHLQRSHLLQVMSQSISEQQAVAIATKHALRSHRSLKRFTVVACEQSIFWRIIFDGGGPEYIIDKQSGAIRRIQRIPQDWAENSRNARSIKKAEITREKAIEIATEDASRGIVGEDMNKFIISACELQEVWRVFVEFKLHIEPNGKPPILPHASPPNYVIDKGTGKIVFKQR